MSKLKLKKAPSLASPEAINDVVRRIYDDINDIVNSVNNEFGDYDTQRGKIGNIRIKKVDNESYRLEAKTSDGWAAVGLSILEEKL
tara:strand:- start:3148 stop:3405 length:258 start_codon:yes stop_codon:yes gene_type:complete